jgi:hypothetical protein
VSRAFARTSGSLEPEGPAASNYARTTRNAAGPDIEGVRDLVAHELEERRVDIVREVGSRPSSAVGSQRGLLRSCEMVGPLQARALVRVPVSTD